MISFSFSLEDVTRVRFQPTPFGEMVWSISSLTRPLADSPHRRWASEVRARVRTLDMSPLCGVIPPAGYVPDFLTPRLGERAATIDAELAAVAETPLERVVEELEFLHTDTNLSRQWRDLYAPVRRRLLADPAAALRLLINRLAVYWQLALEPHWRRMKSRLDAEVMRRSEFLGSTGLAGLFGTLNDSIRWKKPQLVVATRYNYRTDLNGSGLVLSPSVFCSPQVMTMLPPYQPSLVFPIPDVKRFWEGGSGDSLASIAALMGRMRASVLAELQVPTSTTELAHRLNVTPSAVSQHLTVLREAGLVTGHRIGRQVLYARTATGAMLLSAS